MSSRPAAESGAKAGDYVRSRNDGQLGELVERDGRLMVRLDRGRTKNGLVDHLDVYQPALWLPSPRRMPLSTTAVAAIAYEATSRLRRLRGEYGLKGWEALTETEQKKFTTMAPADDEQRALWDAIFNALTTGRPG